ncbi:MAG: NAD(P)/FAD-dependent oxidoreductase [Anaerolineales bacterium]|jgi:hypothetical protein|nr:NAD(P)/FAD-dependent oxidoreductase [Anaerolineales bacterium]
MINYDLVVIGGGAAGFFAALSAVEARPGMRILILEKSDKLLAKVRISGGGRCNLTHACYDPAQLVDFYPRGSREMRGPFTYFQPKDTITWFEAHGVPLKTESDGRIFPKSDRSDSVIDCLVSEAEKHRLQIRMGCSIQKIACQPNRFEVHLEGGDSIVSRKILFATGSLTGQVSRLVTGLGHTVQPPVPSLFSFSIQDNSLAGLAGVAVSDVELLLRFDPGSKMSSSGRLVARGPALVTHWGLSGPAVLRLSAWGARLLAQSGYQANLQVNWLPGLTLETILLLLIDQRQKFPRRLALDRDPGGRIPERLWKRLAIKADLDPDLTWDHLSNYQINRWAETLTHCIYRIHAKGPFKDEFVTCGGITLKEVNFQTMESRVVPGLYFAGEILDIDGLTGGFNFQAAWTTGWLAGKAAANS